MRARGRTLLRWLVLAVLWGLSAWAQAQPPSPSPSPSHASGERPAIARSASLYAVEQPFDWDGIRWAASVALAVLAGLLTAWWWHSQALRREMARTKAARDETERVLSFVAHELRNAMQSASAVVSLLRQTAPLDAGQQPLLDALGLSARSTLAQLDSLLDRHRLLEGRFVPEVRADSLDRALQAVVDEMLPVAQAKGLQLNFERRTPLEGWWRIDAMRVQQIVRNLLINAVRYSDRGTLTLRAGLDLSEQGQGWRRVGIDVIDQGPGMDEAARASIFDRLAPGDDRPGAGLGLNLCRDLAKALGGTLDVSTSPGRGSTFILRLEAQAAVAPDKAAPARVARLLVVEDSPVYGLLLRQAFEKQGVATVLAGSLQQAREALAVSVAGTGSSAFDLVLADLHLGDGSADELLRFAGEAVKPGARLPPVICMSADFDDATLKRLERAGAGNALTKDIDIAAFASRVLANHLQPAQVPGDPR